MRTPAGAEQNLQGLMNKNLGGLIEILGREREVTYNFTTLICFLPDRIRYTPAGSSAMEISETC